MHRYELFRMRPWESQGEAGSGRVLPTSLRALGFVATRRALSTRPGPFSVALEVRIVAWDEPARASLLGFAEEAATMDLALVTAESTIYVDGVKVLRTGDAVVLAVSGGIYDEPGDARRQWRQGLEQEGLADSAYVEVPSSRSYLRGKVFRRRND